MSKNVGIHPKDIYGHLDKIVPPQHKGVTENYIIDNKSNDIYFRQISQDNVKQIITTFIKNLEIYNLVEKEFSDKTRLQLKKALDDSIRIIKSNKMSSYTFNEMIRDHRKQFSKTINDKINQIYDEDHTQLLAKNFKLFNEYIIDKVPQELYQIKNDFSEIY